MNAERLLALYEKVAEAPDAIARLRRFVLDLAVRGKLIEQDPADEPAAELLKRIAAVRGKVPQTGRSGKKKPADASLTEVSFDLPSGWSHARLSDLVRVVNGRAYRKPELLAKGTPVLRVGNLFTSDHWYYSNLELEADKYCDAGDLIYAWSASFGPFIWNGPKVIYHYHIWKLPLFSKADLNKQFLYLFLLQKTREIKEAGHGISMVHMTKEKMEQLAVPLPPLAEQRRIVAKVEELMALLDGLEAARTAREATRDRLTTASLARLTAPDADPAEFPNHARFALDTFPVLTARADQIKSLRQTILDLAVRGKLVAQDAGDEPASELLKRIAAEKARLVKAGEIRKSRVVSLFERDDLPFSVPLGWTWTQISELGIISPRNEANDDIEASFVPMSMIAADYRVINGHERRPWGDIKKGYTHFAEGDVGLAKITPCFENGKSTVFRNLAGSIGAGTTELHVVRPLIVDADYIVLLLKSPYFIETGIPKMTGTAGQKRVPTEYFTSSPIPLPPLAEQHRIVARVDALMALCDRLEAALTTADTTRARLLEALLHEALAPADVVVAAAE
ncbi:restriction endonuclease subunit S [Paracoccus endophyticus]|uniref:restriction endonuclease subunit S n=1 Tax=Paracoccus endophyticus TaxID=2233774 RepID=UPI000DDBE0EF|nr:restriction endonuclease subunit S [Paracoccus endophyticus]